MKSARQGGVWWGAAAAMAIVLAPTAAVSAGEIIVLESYGRQRPDHAATLTAPLFQELDTERYLSGEALAERIGERISRPGHRSAEHAARAIGLADQGYEQWLDGDLDQAVNTLQRAADLMHANPALFANRSDERPLLYKTLLALSVAHERLGHSERSVAVMAELVRSFPDTPFNRTLFPPDAHQLYRKVRADIERQRKGRLRVQVNDDAVSVFVNERFAGAGGRYEGQVPPGRYRIYTQKGSRPGRLHLVNVEPGVDRTVEIDWDIDGALRTGDGVWLAFADEDQREHLEAQAAVAVSRALGAEGVVVFGIREYRGRHSLVGSTLSLDTGKVTRVAAVALEPARPSAETIQSLARFMAGAEPSPDLILPQQAAEEAPAVSVTTTEARRYGAWKWVALGAGAAAIGTGVAFIRLDGPILDDAGDYTPHQYDTRGVGIGMTIAGAALVAIGATLWLLERPGEAGGTTAALAPTEGGFSVSFAGAF